MSHAILLNYSVKYYTCKMFCQISVSSINEFISVKVSFVCDETFCIMCNISLSASTACHLKLTTPSCDRSAKLSTYVHFGALELGLLRVMRFSGSSGVPFTQGHTKEALGVPEAAFGLE